MTPDKYFAELYAQGVQLDEAQKRWWTKKWEVLGETMMKEYPSTPDEAFSVNTQGLYYATAVNLVRSQRRVCNISYDRTLKVHTAWDLGFADATSIIFFQLSGKEIHIIDFIESSGVSMAEYIKQLKDKPYIYGTHLAPHDIKNHEYSTGITRFETASKLGIGFTLCPDLSINDGIDAVRNAFPRMWFHNSDEVLRLVGHLENYTQRWDKSLGQWSGRPEHDAASHAADSLRYLVLGLDFCQDESQGLTQAQADALWREHGRRI